MRLPRVVTAGADNRDTTVPGHWRYESATGLAAQLDTPLAELPGATWATSGSRDRSPRHFGHTWTKSPDTAIQPGRRRRSQDARNKRGHANHAWTRGSGPSHTAAASGRRASGYSSHDGSPFTLGGRGDRWSGAPHSRRHHAHRSLVPCHLQGLSRHTVLVGGDGLGGDGLERPAHDGDVVDHRGVDGRHGAGVAGSRANRYRGGRIQHSPSLIDGVCGGQGRDEPRRAAAVVAGTLLIYERPRGHPLPRGTRLALLTGRWRALRRITAGPGRIGGLRQAALVLTTMPHLDLHRPYRRRRRDTTRARLIAATEIVALSMPRSCFELLGPRPGRPAGRWAAARATRRQDQAACVGQDGRKWLAATLPSSATSSATSSMLISMPATSGAGKKRAARR